MADCGAPSRKPLTPREPRPQTLKPSALLPEGLSSGAHRRLRGDARPAPRLARTRGPSPQTLGTQNPAPRGRMADSGALSRKAVSPEGLCWAADRRLRGDADADGVQDDDGGRQADTGHPLLDGPRGESESEGESVSVSESESESERASERASERERERESESERARAKETDRQTEREREREEGRETRGREGGRAIGSSERERDERGREGEIGETTDTTKASEIIVCVCVCVVCE